MKRYRKFLVAGATALTTLSAVLPGGVTAQEGIAVVLAALGALGVYAIPNDTTTRDLFIR